MRASVTRKLSQILRYPKQATVSQNGSELDVSTCVPEASLFCFPFHDKVKNAFIFFPYKVAISAFVWDSTPLAAGLAVGGILTVTLSMRFRVRGSFLFH